MSGPTRLAFGMCAAVLIAPAADAYVVTYSADFSSAALDPNLTSAVETGNTQIPSGPFSITSGGGQLVISKAATATAQGGNVSANVVTNFSVSGDFSASVEVDLSGLSPDLAAAAGLSFFIGPVDPNYTNVQVDGFADTSQGSTYDVAVGFSQIGGGGFTTGPAAAIPPVIFYKLDRVGDAVSEYYSTDDAIFTLLQSLTDSTLTGDASFGLGLGDFTATMSAESVTFSNFDITYDAPEPASIASFFSGLTGLAWVRRRKIARSP